MRIIEVHLIRAIKNKGSKEAASQLIALYYKDIYKYVYKQNSDVEVAKDLTQEIFMSMLSSINSYDDRKSSFKTWLYKIASNKIIDFYRSKFYKYKTIIDEIDDFNLCSDENIEKDFLIREDIKMVMQIVNTMDSGIQEIFRLKVFAEMSFKEISNVTNLSESTVKTRYYSTIKKIKKTAMEV